MAIRLSSVVGLQAEAIGGAVGAANAPARDVEHLTHVLLLDIDQAIAALLVPEQRPRQFDRQLAAARADHRPLDDVAELADVARPRVLPQRVHRLAGDRLDLLAERGRELVHVPPHEQRDVLDAARAAAASESGTR